MKYIIAAMTIVNDIHYADGAVVPGIIGGGVFCVGGIKPFEDDICYVTAAADDFEDYYGEYFNANGLSTAGVKRSLPHTHYNNLEYYPDGRWREYSKYGEQYLEQHFDAWQIRGEDVAKFCGERTRGIYTESGAEEIFWRDDELNKIREAAPSAKLMWEIPTYNILNPEQKKLVLDTVRKCDIFSINLPEGEVLFGVSGEREVIKRILELGIPCFFRCGTKGAYMLMDSMAVFAPGVGVELTVDPTGCGNCSTAAAMYGFAEGLDPLMIVTNANVAAHYNALQLGPYPVFSEQVKKRVRTESRELFERLKSETKGTDYER